MTKGKASHLLKQTCNDTMQTNRTNPTTHTKQTPQDTTPNKPDMPRRLENDQA